MISHRFLTPKHSMDYNLLSPGTARMRWRWWSSRGAHASLFLETRNGVVSGTLRLQTQTTPEATSAWNVNKRKSPSTVRRDRQRLKTFMQRKTLQESLGSPPINRSGQYRRTSQEVTPGILYQNETKLDKTILEQQKTDTIESEKEKINKVEDAPSNLDRKEIDEILGKPLAINMELNLLRSMVMPKNDKENDSSDNLEEAKIWSRNQKQSLGNKH